MTMTDSKLTTYTLSTTNDDVKFRRHHRDCDPTDGTGSLTYSAASSINSAGESTDSSFADIMRVLDVQDSKELAAYIKKENSSKRTSAVSVASSLNYSTDGESALEGAKLLQTITGQPSDSHGFDGGGYGNEPIRGDNDIMFAPAEPVDLSRRKKDKKRRQHGSNASPKSKPKEAVEKTAASPPPTPPMKQHVTPPKKKSTMVEDDDDIWYAKWWMSCFPDAFKELMPKR